MKMPLNCLALSSQVWSVASQLSVRMPLVTSALGPIAASARRFTLVRICESPVARHNSSPAPIARPWLYVHTFWPLLVQASVRPSLTRPLALIMPLCWNHAHAVLERASHCVSPGMRLCNSAVSRIHKPLVTAFLYVRSAFHHTPPPQVLVSQ